MLVKTMVFILVPKKGNDCYYITHWNRLKRPWVNARNISNVMEFDVRPKVTSVLVNDSVLSTFRGYGCLFGGQNRAFPYRIRQLLFLCQF